MKAAASSSRRFRLWFFGSILALGVFVGLVLFLSSSQQADGSSKLKEHGKYRPVVIDEKKLPVTPFEAHPFPAFKPSAVYEVGRAGDTGVLFLMLSLQVTVARFPHEEAHVQAYLLDIPFPNKYEYVTCEGAMFVNRLWDDGYVINMTCGHPKPRGGVAVIDKGRTNQRNMVPYTCQTWPSDTIRRT